MAPLRRRVVVFERHEVVWSLTSTRANRISGYKKFRASPKKDFFNTIGAKRTFAKNADVKCLPTTDMLPVSA
jgi:hypothetical protein